jgi:hypothetical protein
VLTRLVRPLGEFTVVIEIGYSTESEASPLPSGADMAAEIGRMIDVLSISRRQAIAEIARKHGRSPNEVYAAIEQAKKSTD